MNQKWGTLSHIILKKSWISAVIAILLILSSLPITSCAQEKESETMISDTTQESAESAESTTAPQDAASETERLESTTASQDIASETAAEEPAVLTPVTLNEVAHSIFYAPQYVAIELGYFEEEGIDLTVVTGFGADKTMTALISGDADIGFMGSESSIYTYSGGASDAPVNFAQLTCRAGNFLVGREADEDFTWSDLIGKDVLGGRAGGMPEMVFEYILKQNGIDTSEVNINQSIDFGSTAAAFSSGQGDYTVEFEPSATALEQEGVGYVLASLGTDSGYVPYTAYCAKSSYIEAHLDIIQSFTNALQKGMDYVNTHTPEEIAAVIAPQFPENDEDTIATITARYYEQGTWKEELIFTEESFDLLQDILESAGELDERVPYEDLVTTEFAETAYEQRQTEEK
ncbi:MAG: ABC transporter substrate-binding protein [Lachnospiraceae bacterium]|nr:ABC transporter substrate-binding protein [Lachnospiraceae bacterium]